MLLIGNGLVITRNETNEIIEDGCIAILDEKIVEAGLTKDLKLKYREARFIDARGMLIMPGFVNTHMHYYSTFARAMASDSPPAKNFTDILKGLWWRLDKTLTLEDVYYSALVMMIEEIKCGVTTVFDHHASPYAIRGSLFKIAEAATAAGIRSNLCYETSDRDGEEKALEGIKENTDFIRYCQSKNDDMLKGMFGLHASMTVSSQTLDRCFTELTGLNTGFHVHAAEGIEDVLDAKAKYNKGVIERFYDAGVLTDKTIAVHCIHISDAEMDLIKQKNAIVVHNPESNMGNAVGCSPVLKMDKLGILIGLGTDGYTADMIESYKVGNLIHKHENHDPNAAWTEIPKLLFENNRNIVGRFITKPVGILKTGALADVIVVDYDAPTPVTKDNINSHILFGVTGKSVVTTVINGDVVMENRELKHLDEAQIMAKSREAAQEVWGRFLSKKRGK